jgi:putative ABC transport system permease protein
MLRTLSAADLGRDLRLSFRTLLRAPILALTIVLTVGLGIGGTTAMFGAVHAAFLRPLPYPDPEQLVWIYTDDPPFQFRFSAVDYLALDGQQIHFTSVAGFTNKTMTYSDGAASDVLRGRAVTWRYFRTLGLTPAAGRDFIEIDGRPGSPPSVILSHAFWRDRLGSRVDIIGRPVRLDGADHVVVGVLPPAVGPLEARQDVFVVAQIGPPTRKGPFLYWIVGRLKPGVSRDATSAELRAINRRLFPLWRASYQNDKATWALVDLKDRLVRDARTTGGLMLAAVVVVWLLACLNAANMLVARVSARRRELGVRVALGASRARVLQVLLVEAAMLAGGAAAVGFAITVLGLGLLRRIGAEYLPRTHEIAFDAVVGTVFAATVLVSLVLFGVIPAVQGVAASSGRAQIDAGRTTTGSRAMTRFRHVLVGMQFAIAMPLLVLAVLLFASLTALRSVDLGIHTEGVITASLRLPAASYRDRARIDSFWDEAGRRLRALPGVTGAAFADALPTESSSNINNFDLEAFPTPSGQAQPATPWISITPEYFDTLGIRLLEGRLLDERDARTEALDSIVVDRTWAARFFPGQSAVGRRLREGGCTQCPWTTVVGVVSDVQAVGLDPQNTGTVYAPLAGGPARYVVLRSAGDPTSIVGSVRTAVRELDPGVPITNVASVAQLVDQAIGTPAILARLLISFAAVALVLAFVGIFGVMGHYVQQHAREISVRVALGGSPARITELLARRALLMVATGATAGLPVAYTAASLVSSLLFSVSPAQPTTYLLVLGFLFIVGAIACLVPVRRALRMSPAALLRV